MNYKSKLIPLLIVSMTVSLSGNAMAATSMAKSQAVENPRQNQYPTTTMRIFDKQSNAYQFFAYNPYTNNPAVLIKYSGGNPYKAKVLWQQKLSLKNSRAIHVTNMAINNNTMYIVGYFTGALMGMIGSYQPMGGNSAFIAALDPENGNMLWTKQINPAINAKEAHVIPNSLSFTDNRIEIKGITTGGIKVYGQTDNAQSAKDEFIVSFDAQGKLYDTSLKQISKVSPLAFQASSSNNVKGPIVDGLIDWGVDKTLDWASSKIAQAFGFKSSDQIIEDDLSQINAEVNQALVDLNNIQNELNDLLGAFVQLYNQVLSDQSENYEVELGFLQNGISSDWSSFANATNGIHALSDLNTNTETLQHLAPILTQDNLTAIWKNLTNLLDTNQSTGFYYALNKALNTQVLALFPESNWGIGNDPIQYLDGYNESLMNVYMSTLVSIQQAYVMITVAAYLQASGIAPFNSLTSPVPGVDPSDDYATQQAKINAYFNNMIQGARDSNNNLTGNPGIFDITSSMLITDGFDTSATEPAGWDSTGLPFYSQVYANNYHPQPAKTQAQMPPAQTDEICAGGGTCYAMSWTDACQIFTWDGTSSNPVTGQYGNSSLKAWCGPSGYSWEYYTLNLNYREQSNTPLSYYFYPNMFAQVQAAMLQPRNYTVNNVYSLGSFPGDVLLFTISFKGSGNDFTIGTRNFGGVSSGSPWIAAFNNSGSMCTGSGQCGYPWTIDSNAFVHSHSGDYSYNTTQGIYFPDGYNGVFNLFSNGHDMGDDQIHWDFALQCVNGMMCQNNGALSVSFGPNPANSISLNSNGTSPYFSNNY